jgi:hypothetical protein
MGIVKRANIQCVRDVLLLVVKAEGVPVTVKVSVGCSLAEDSARYLAQT